MIVISDTSVFTNLAVIGHLHLLQQLYERIFIPTAVYQELTVDPPVPGSGKHRQVVKALQISVSALFARYGIEGEKNG